MRRPLLVAAVLLCLVGTVWLLQGVNVLPGSVMTGDPFWAWTGGLLLLLGLAALYLGRRGAS